MGSPFSTQWLSRNISWGRGGLLIPQSSGIIGYDTPTVVVNSTAASTTYNGTITSVTAGTRLYIIVGALGNTGSNASTWTITLNGGAPISPTSSTTGGVDPIVGIFEIDAPATGDINIVITTGIVAARSLSAIVWKISGHNISSPTVSSGATRNSSNVTSFAAPAAVTPVNNNVVFIGAAFIKYTTTALNNPPVTGVDGYGTASTGAISSGDHLTVYGWKLVPTPVATTFTYGWTTAVTVAAGYFQIHPA